MRIFRISMLLTVLVLSTITASGCVSKVPGTRYGGTYCIETRYSQAYQDTIESSRYSYGRYKDYSLGGNRGLCGLREFHVLDVKWVTKSGVVREETIDVRPLIKEMSSSNKIPVSSLPSLLVEIVDRTFSMKYVIYKPDPDKRSSEWQIYYPLYSSTK